MSVAGTVSVLALGGLLMAVVAGPVQAQPMSSTAAAKRIADKFSTRETQKSDELEMLERARRDVEDANRPAKPVLEGAVSPAAPVRKAAEVSEAERRAELQRLSEKLRAASQKRMAKPAAPAVDSPWKTETVEAPKIELAPHVRSSLGVKTDNPVLRETRATVLMVMTPGDRGIRRFEKTADPILCTGEGCYISNGPAVPARFLAMRKSFGFANSFGPRAGACAQQLACVFRSVELGDGPAFVQPVDLRVIHHDRREMKQVAADDSCRVEGGRLTCARAVRADNYTLWIVPESVAQAAGGDLLSRAIAEGLVASRAAEVPWQSQR